MSLKDKLTLANFNPITKAALIILLLVGVGMLAISFYYEYEEVRIRNSINSSLIDVEVPYCKFLNDTASTGSDITMRAEAGVQFATNKENSWVTDCCSFWDEIEQAWYITNCSVDICNEEPCKILE